MYFIKVKKFNINKDLNTVCFLLLRIYLIYLTKSRVLIIRPYRLLFPNIEGLIHAWCLHVLGILVSPSQMVFSRAEERKIP